MTLDDFMMRDARDVTGRLSCARVSAVPMCGENRNGKGTARTRGAQAASRGRWCRVCEAVSRAVTAVSVSAVCPGRSVCRDSPCVLPVGGGVPVRSWRTWASS